MACGTGHVKIVFAPLTKVVILHMQAFIVQIMILGLKSSFLVSEICLTMFLAMNKQF